MVTTERTTNRVNLEQVRLWNSKKIWLLQCLKGHKSLGSLLSVVEDLIVSGDGQTNGPRDRYAVLLSCLWTAKTVKRGEGSLVTYCGFKESRNLLESPPWTISDQANYLVLALVLFLVYILSTFFGFTCCVQLFSVLHVLSMYSQFFCWGIFDFRCLIF